MARKHKSEELTPRQRQSQQLMRERASKKKRRELLRKVAIYGGGFLCVTMLASGLWLWKSGTAARVTDATVDAAYAMTARAGFAVQALYLEGRNRTSMDEIDKAMDIQKGDPILRLSLDEVRARLEKVESVKFAAVERALPGTIYVRIVEREPVAMWQHQGKVSLVDDNGVVMNGLDLTPYQKLPLIIGEDAPKHLPELMAMLGTQPELAKRFAAAIYVSDRRWNIRLSGNSLGDVEVKLPEMNPADAWKKLAEMEQHDQVLDRDVKAIDLRLDGKVFIKLAPQQSIEKAQGAKDT